VLDNPIPKAVSFPTMHGQTFAGTSQQDASFDLREVVVRTVASGEEQRYQDLMQQHHYLGSLPKISETLWYVATWREEWVSLLSFSASALKCAARDRWIGWSLRQHYGRLKLVVNNSRFLILPKVVTFCRASL